MRTRDSDRHGRRRHPKGTSLSLSSFQRAAVIRFCRQWRNAFAPIRTIFRPPPPHWLALRTPPANAMRSPCNTAAAAGNDDDDGLNQRRLWRLAPLAPQCHRSIRERDDPIVLRLCAGVNADVNLTPIRRPAAPSSSLACRKADIMRRSSGSYSSHFRVRVLFMGHIRALLFKKSIEQCRTKGRQYTIVYVYTVYDRISYVSYN